MKNEKRKSDLLKRLKRNKNKIKAGPAIQYPPGFTPDCNVTFDGKAGMAKLTLPALGEIMRMLGAQIGKKPRVFTMPIELKKIDAPLVNVIWISPDIAAAIEEHMITTKEKKKEIKLAADVADDTD